MYTVVPIDMALQSMERGKDMCARCNAFQPSGNTGDQNISGLQQLHLARIDRGVAECFCLKSLCCGTGDLSVSELLANAQKSCLDHAGRRCKCASNKFYTLGQDYSSCRHGENLSCVSLSEVCHCKGRPQCRFCCRSVSPEASQNPGPGDPSCAPWCGWLGRSTCPTQRSTQHNISSAADYPRNAAASLELCLSVQHLDILRSLYLVRCCKADPFFPLQFSDGGNAGDAADDYGPGSGIFCVEPKQRNDSRGKWGTAGFFQASFAIRAAQRLASMLRSSPLQLLYSGQKSTAETNSNTSTKTASERHPSPHKLAWNFPPEPSEDNAVYLMRCLYTWGAAASHQLGYEVFSSAVGKLHQPPRCISFRGRGLSSSAAVDRNGPHACGIGHAVSASDAGAVGASGGFPYASRPLISGSLANVKEETSSPSVTHTSVSIDADKTTSAGYSRNPRMRGMGQSDSGNGRGCRRNKPVMSSLQVQFVRCGPSISLAVTLDGKVWVWGKNADGKRGISATPVVLEIPDFEDSRDFWAEGTEPHVSKSTETAAEAVETTATGEVRAGVVREATELLQVRQGGAGDAGSCSPEIYEGVRKDVLLRVVDAAVGAQHCLLLVDVLRGDDRESQRCSARPTDSGNFTTHTRISTEQQKHYVGRSPNSTGLNTRISHGLSPRLGGGLLLPSDPSELLSFCELMATHEEGDEEGDSPPADKEAGSSASASASSGAGNTAATGETVCLRTATAGESTCSSLVIMRRLYVWGSNRCHQLGFAHNLSQAAGCRVDVVAASQSSPISSSSSSCPSPSCGPSLRFSPLVLPDLERKSVGGAGNTAESDRMASSAAVCEAFCIAGTAATGGGDHREAAERKCSMQHCVLTEHAASTLSKRLHAPATRTMAGKRVRVGQSKQAELDALASYTPVVLTNSVSSRIRSPASDVGLASVNRGIFTEEFDRKKRGNAADFVCTTRRSVCGREADVTAGAAGASPKGLRLQLHVTAVAAGWTHSLLLLQDGRVYAFGDNSHGQCAQHPSIASVSSPTLVTRLPSCCAIVAAQRTNAAISVPPQSTFIWGGCPISGCALLAATAASSAATCEATAAQQRATLRHKQQCLSFSCVRCRPSVGIADAAAAGLTSDYDASGATAAAPSGPTACGAARVVSRPRSGGGSGPCPTSGMASLSSCSAGGSCSSRKIGGSPTSYLAYFTPLRLKGSGLLRAAAFCGERKAAGGAPNGCAVTTGHEAAVAAETENGWHVQPAARHCPVLRPESIAISDSLGIAVGTDERLYAWHCRDQRPCVVRPVVAYVASSLSGSSVADAPSCSSSSSSYSAAHRSCVLPHLCFLDGPCCSSSIPSSSVDTWASPPFSAQLSSLCTSDIKSQPSTLSPRSLNESKFCSAEAHAAATAPKTLPSVGHSASSPREAGLPVTSSSSSSFCTRLQAQPPRCRVRQLVVTTTRVFLLTEDGLLFTAVPPQQTRKEQHARQPEQQHQDHQLLHTDRLVEGCADPRSSELEYCVFHFHPVYGLASVQQVSGSDIHAAAVVAIFSPAFPPFDKPLSHTSPVSLYDPCVDTPTVASSVPRVAPDTGVSSRGFCRSRVSPSSCGSLETLPSDGACTRRREPHSAEAGVSSISATPPAASSAQVASSSSGDMAAGVDARVRLPRRWIAAVSNIGSLRERLLAHRAPDAPPAAVSGASQSVATGASAMSTADLPASSPACASSRQPSPPQGNPSHLGTSASSCTTSLSAGAADCFQVPMPAVGMPAVSAFAVASAGVAASTATGPFCGVSAAANVGSIKAMFNDGATSSARIVVASDRFSCTDRLALVSRRGKSHAPPNAPAAALGARTTLPSLAAFAAQALLRGKDPLPPSLPFMLYVVAPAALCVRDQPLFDFCCLYLVFNLPILFAVLGPGRLPSPLPDANSYVVTEHQPAAEKGSVGNTSCCCCNISAGCCSSSSSVLSSRSTAEGSNSTSHLCNNGSSASSMVTENSRRKKGKSSNHLYAVDLEMDGQPQSKEEGSQEFLRHIPAAAGVHYLVRGMMEQLFFKCTSDCRGPCLEERKQNAAHLPWHPPSRCHCWAQPTSEQREGLWNAVDGYGTCTPVAVNRRRKCSLQHVRGCPDEASLVAREEDALDSAEVTEGGADSLAPGALSLAVAALQHGVWWEEDGTEDEIRRGTCWPSTESRGNGLYNGNRGETARSSPRWSPAWNIRAPTGGGAAAEYWAPEATALRDILRAAVEEYLSDYICLPFSSEPLTTEEGVRESHRRSRLPAFSSVGPFQEPQRTEHREDGILQLEEEKLRELFSARLAVAGAADRLVERLKRQPLLYLLQRRASELVARCGSNNDVLTLGRGMQERAAERSNCSCSSSYERQLLLRCWPNILHQRIDSGAVHHGLRVGAAEDDENSKAIMKRCKRKQAMKGNRAKQAHVLVEERIQGLLAPEETLGKAIYQSRMTKSSDNSSKVVAGGGRESGETPTIPVATPPGAAVAACAAKQKTTVAATSEAEEEISVCKNSAEGVEENIACHGRLRGPSLKILWRREPDTPEASASCQEGVDVTEARTTADRTLNCSCLAVCTRQTRSTKSGTVLNLSEIAAASEDPSTRLAYAPDHVASRTLPCDTATSASAIGADSALCGAVETVGAVPVSLPCGAAPAKGHHAWVRGCHSAEAADKLPTIPIAEGRLPATSCTARVTSASSAAGDNTLIKVEAVPEPREAPVDFESPLSVSESCSGLLWKEVLPRKKQHKKEGLASNSTMERMSDILNFRRSCAADVYWPAAPAGGTKAVPQCPAITRRVTAARPRPLPTAAEAALAPRGSGEVADAAGVGRPASGSRPSIYLTSASKKTCESSFLLGVSSAPTLTSKSGAAATAGPAGVVSVQDQQVPHRCQITLYDFLLPTPPCKGKREQKAGQRKGRRQSKHEEDREEKKEIGPSQTSENLETAALLHEKSRRRRWGEEVISRGSVDQEDIRKNNNNSSHSNRDTSSCPISSTSRNGNSASSTSGVFGTECTSKAEAHNAVCGEGRFSSRPQSLAEVMREEEQGRREKQLKRQWQLQQERLRSAKTANRGSEQPTILLRLRGCVQEVTALAASEKVHKYKVREIKHTHSAGRHLLRQTVAAADDALSSNPASCNPVGNNTPVSNSSCCGTNNGDLDNTISVSSNMSGNNNSSSRNSSSKNVSTNSNSSNNSSNSSSNSSSRKTYEASRISGYGGEKNSNPDVVSTCSRWKVPRASNHPRSLRGDGVSYNCWGLKAALRAQGDGAVDLMEVQRLQLQERLAEQLQRDDEAELQEALWLIAQMEEREKSKAKRLEMEVEQAAATAGAATETPPTAAVPLAAHLAAGTSTSRGGAAATAIESSSSVPYAALYGRETPPQTALSTSIEKFQVGPTVNMSRSSAAVYKVHSARKGQCAFPQQRTSRDQRRRQCRKE